MPNLKIFGQLKEILFSDFSIIKKGIFFSLYGAVGQDIRGCISWFRSGIGRIEERINKRVRSRSWRDAAFHRLKLHYSFSIVDSERMIKDNTVSMVRHFYKHKTAH